MYILIFVCQKVKEEDDAKVDQKLQAHLKKRRYRKRRKVLIPNAHPMFNVALLFSFLE